MSGEGKQNSEVKYRVLGEKSSDDNILLHVVDMECAEGMLDGDYALSGLDPNESLIDDGQRIPASVKRKEDVELYFMSRKDYGIPSIIEDASMGYLSLMYNKGYTDCPLSLRLERNTGSSLTFHLLHLKECKSLERVRETCRERLKKYVGPYRYFTLLTISVKSSTSILSRKRKSNDDLR